MPAASSSSRTASVRSETVPKAGASRPRTRLPRLPARFAAPVLAFAAVFAQQRTWRRAAADRRRPRPRRAHRDRPLADSGSRPGAAVHQPPPGPGPGRPGRPRGGRPPGRRLRPGRPRGARHRRHDRAAAGRAHRRRGRLPRPGALLEGPPRRGRRPEPAQPDAPGPGPPGGARPGAAVPHRARPLGAPRPRARQAAQEADRPGAAGGPPSAPVLPGRGVVPPGDGGSAAPDLPASLARHGPVCITRPRLDAALCGPAPPRKPGTVGRPRTEGARLPNLPDVLADEAPSRVEVAVPGRHGGGDRTAEACPGTAVRCHAGLPVVPIRRVLPRDPRGRLDPRALLRAEPESDPLQVARRFVRRWRVGVTFREARDHSASRRGASGRAGRSPAPRPARPGCSRPWPRSPRASTAAPAPPRGAASRARPRRHPRRRPAAVVARAGFAPVVAAVRGEETQPRPPPRHRLRALPGRPNGQSRDKWCIR